MLPTSEGIGSGGGGITYISTCRLVVSPPTLIVNSNYTPFIQLLTKSCQNETISSASDDLPNIDLIYTQVESAQCRHYENIPKLVDTPT